MTRKQKRLAGIGLIASVLILAVGLVLLALRDEIVFFYSPTDIIKEAKVKNEQRFRLGGLVKEGSVVKDGKNVSFTITDTEFDIAVNFSGILPDLFREGQGVIAEGKLSSDTLFVADSVLAKHDENYMPKEVAETLKEKGMWQGTETE